MRNTLITGIFVFLIACGGGENIESVDALIEENNIDALKAKRTEIAASIKAAEMELDKIDQALHDEDKVEKLPLISVYDTKEEAFYHYVELQGNVETDQNILVYPEIQGNLMNFKANMGDRVAKGQLVASIDDGGLRQQLAQLEEQAALSKITYERQKRLWDQKIGSEMEFLRAETAYNANQEAVNQLKKQLEKASVTAPFAGQIDETLADEGQLVSPGQTPLFRLVNLKDMFIKADVPEAYLKNIHPGRKVLVELPVLDTVINASVNKVSNYINPDNRTFRIEIDIPNPDGLVKPNLTSKIKVNDYINKTAILIPQSIISEDASGKQYVYVAKATEANKAIVHKTFIETGRKQGDLIEITQGLNANEAIVKEGARTVKDQQEVEIIK